MIRVQFLSSDGCLSYDRYSRYPCGNYSHGFWEMTLLVAIYGLKGFANMCRRIEPFIGLVR